MTRSAVAAEAAEYAIQVRHQHSAEVHNIAHRLLDAITHDTPLTHYTETINTAILGLLGVNYMTMASIRNFEEFFSSIGVSPEQQADLHHDEDAMPPLVEDAPAPSASDYETDDDSLSRYGIRPPELLHNNEDNEHFGEAGKFVREPVPDID